MNAVVDPILIRESSETATVSERTAFVGHLFLGDILEKNPEKGRPWSREKAQINRETEAMHPKRFMENTMMTAVIIAVAAFWLLVAWMKTAMIGNPVGVAKTASVSVIC